MPSWKRGVLLWRLGAAALIAVSATATCSGGDNSGAPIRGDGALEPGSSGTAAPLTTTRPGGEAADPTAGQASEITAPPTPGGVPEPPTHDGGSEPAKTPGDDPETSTTLSPVSTGTGPPPAPANLKCLAGVGEGELFVEWDAPADSININRLRVYVSFDGGPFLTNQDISLEGVDTERSSGSRWGVTVTSLPANVPLRIAVTTFNAIGAESESNPVSAHYTDAGEACGSGVIPTTTTTASIPTNCTVGCE